jgi:hypothetical protein
MFCWHDWAVFNAPDKSMLVKKIGKRYVTRYFHQGVKVGVTDDVKTVSDLVCYKCGGKKLNLTNVLNKIKKKALKEQEAEDKKKNKQKSESDKTEEVKKKKSDAIKLAREQMELT